MSAPDIKAQADLLPGVPETIEKLRQSQEAFTEKNAAYKKAYAENAETPSASEIRRTLMALINGKLNIYLSAAVMMNPDKYGTYVTAVEKAIEEINQKVKQRSEAKNK